MLAWLAVLGACASDELVTRRLGTVLGHTVVIESKTPPPSWLNTLPNEAGYRYVMGEAEGADTRDEALEKAWVNAFVRLGMTEFPELGSISTRHVETLKNTKFERRFALDLDNVNWSGIHEVSENQSPYVIFDRTTKRYIAFRLLKWATSDIATARREIKAPHRHAIPLPPEATQREEQALVEATREVQALNHRLQFRKSFLENVFHGIQCGATVADLARILGSPDRANPFNEHLVEKEYFWGDYRVECTGDNPAVVAITSQDGHGQRRIVCHDRPSTFLNE